MKLYIKVLLLSGIALAVQSCGIIKDYKRPNVGTEEVFRAQASQTDTTSIGSRKWTDLFTDDLLRDYVSEALNNNFDIQIALKNLQITEAYIKQAKASFAPSVGVEASSSTSKLSSNSRTGSFFSNGSLFNEIQINGYLSWEIDIWGKLRSQKKAAVAKYMQTTNFVKLVKSKIVASVANQYYTLLSLDSQREILLSTIENRRQSVETIKALKQAGTTTEVAVKQNEALLYTAQSLLIDIENQIKITENSLSILLGKSPSAIERNQLDDQQIPVELQTGVPIQLLSNRPDVVAAEYNLINAFELSNSARASMFPVLSIGASGGLNSTNFVNLFSLNSLFANLIGNLTQPIFNRRALKTQKEVKKAEKEIALLEYQQTILNSYQEVSNALYTYNANAEKLVLKVQENEAYSDAIEFSEELLSQGLANYLEVLRAKDNALNVQLNMITLQLNKLTSTVQLYKALGGGWQ
jgi:NodT family efflux transporter outer membrane factor (OMF) lipoprotein